MKAGKNEDRRKFSDFGFLGRYWSLFIIEGSLELKIFISSERTSFLFSYCQLHLYNNFTFTEYEGMNILT